MESSRAMNGWQRLGVVASAIWLLGTSAIAALELWGSPASVFSQSYAFHFVEFIPSPIQANVPEGFTAVDSTFLLGAFLKAALLPPLAAWLAVFITYRVVQWVRAGFAKK